MSEHLLYGLRAAGVDATAAVLGRYLKYEFQRRESTVWGFYMRARTPGVIIRIVEQLDPYGEAHEPDFGDYATLVRVDGDDVPSIEGVEVDGEGIALLRARTVEPRIR